MIYNLRTNLAKAKGDKALKSGSKHWWDQRITAVLLLISSIWLMFFILKIIHQDLEAIIKNVQKPYNITPLVILVVTSLYHSMLGMQIIIEDYIHCPKLRIRLIIFLKIFCIITTISSIVALFYILK